MNYKLSEKQIYVKLFKTFSLYKEFLALDAELPNSLVAAAHFKLANLYESQQNWLAVNEHAQYVIGHSPLAYDKERAVDLLELAKKEILIKKLRMQRRYKFSFNFISFSMN